MHVERINPPTLLPPEGHTHIVRVTGGTTLYVSGQGAYDVDRHLVGPGDYYAQTKQAFTNVLTALNAVGASYHDVVKATYYVARVTPDALGDFARAMNEVLGSESEPPAATFVGVQSLAYDEMLVEIDVIAVVDSHDP